MLASNSVNQLILTCHRPFGDQNDKMRHSEDDKKWLSIITTIQVDECMIQIDRVEPGCLLYLVLGWAARNEYFQASTLPILSYLE